MPRWMVRTVAVLAGSAALLAPAAPAWAGFGDVPGSHWAAASIRYVAVDRNWMRDFGTEEFKPGARLQRRHLARAIVRAFAPGAEPDPSITFTDLPPEDPFYPFANVAVKKGWLRAPDGAFDPTGHLDKRALDRALVMALGLDEEIAGLDAVHTTDGTALDHPSGFPYLVLANRLGLHHNHPGDAEQRELLPGTEVKRADAAWALHHAAIAEGTWKITSLQGFRDFELPDLNADRTMAVEYAFRYAGYPYVYAGEWHRPTPSGYCCGAQAQGGFDCSGFVWWVVKRPADGWDNTSYRPYTGWPLTQRSSRDMAQATSNRLSYADTKPGDLMFFDGDGGTGWKGVDHVALYLGRGWAIDSSGSRAGVSITWVRDGWYRDTFVWSRRVIR